MKYNIVLPRWSFPKLLLILAITILPFLLNGQTVIWTSTGDINNASLGPQVWNSGTINITGCSSISFSMSYSSSLDWPGTGNMESNADCAGCAGDPFDPITPQCDGCWDFFYFDFFFEGAVELTDLIGAGNNPQFDSWTWDSNCLDPDQNYTAELNAITQTWAGDEIITFENLMITCWERPIVTFDPSDEVCEGEDIEMEVSSDYSNVQWSGPGGFADSGNPVTLTNPSLANDGTYTVTADDLNGCPTSFDYPITINAAPDVNPPLSDPEACDSDGDGEAEFDLTIFDNIVNGGSGIIPDWYQDLADYPGSPIGSPDTYTTSSTTIYVATDNGQCTSAPIPVNLVVTSGPSVTIDIIDTDVCEGVAFVFDAVTDPSIMDFTWEYPSTTGIPPINVSGSTHQVLTPTMDFSGTYMVTVDDGAGCTASSSIVITVVPEPEANVTTLPICNPTSYDLTQHDDDINATDDVSYFDGNPLNGDELFSPADLTGVTSIWAVTDNGTCTNQVELMIDPVMPTGTIDGGGTLCPGFCTEDANDLMLDLSGGNPPYMATIEINVSFINTQITLPNIFPNGTVSLCVDDIIFPEQTDFDGDGVDDIVVPNLNLGFSVELIEVMDADGCVGPGSGVIDYVIESPANAADPGGPYAQCSAGEFDLTTYDDAINSSATILWFEDNALQNPIANPTNYLPATTPMTVYAVADNGSCLSNTVELVLELTIAPDIDPINDVIECEEYQLPIVAGDNLGSNVSYESSNGILYVDGDFVTEAGIYTVTAGTDPSCMDTETFDLTLIPLPEIIAPLDELMGCGSIELPTIDVLDLDGSGTVGYFTGSGGTGVQYSAGEVINTSDLITQIYVYADNGNGCTDDIEVDLIFSGAIEYMLPVYDPSYCGAVLLDLIGNAGPDVQYFTEMDGAGTSYGQGEMITDPGVYTLYVYDPTLLDQACVLNANASVTFEVIAQNDIDAIQDIDACMGTDVALPAITGTGLTGDEAYFSEANGQGDIYAAGDMIGGLNGDITLFIYSPDNPCADEESFNINFQAPPNAGLSTGTFTICQGATEPVDFEALLGMHDVGGDWTDLMSSGADLSNPSMVNISNLGTGDFEYNYAINDPVCGSVDASINITVIDPPNAGLTGGSTTVCNNDPEGSVIDFEMAFGLTLPGQGTLIDNSFTGLVSGTTADFLGYAEGAYTFSYNIQGVNSADEFCPSYNSIHTVNVVAGPNAGADNSIETCSGAIIDLSNLLSVDADGTGSFDIDGFTLTGANMDMWDTQNVDPNIPFEVEYIVGDAASACGADTSMFIVTLTSDVTAGTALLDNEVCAGEMVSLFDFLDGESAGGTFTDQSNPQNTNTGVWTATESTTFEYAIESAPGCSGDTEIIEVQVITGPSISNELSSQELCEGECAALSFVASDNVFVNYQFEDQATGEFVMGTLTIDDGSFLIQVCMQGDELSFISEDTINFTNTASDFTIEFFNPNTLNGDCEVDATMLSNFQIQTYNSFLLEIEEDVCPSGSVEYNGQSYFEDTDLSGTTAAGCDSSVFIRVNELPIAEEDVTGTFCEGLNVPIGGEDYTINTQTTVILAGGSQFGCDSIINIDIKFEDASYNVMEPTICIGDTFDFDGVELYEGFETFELVIPDGSVANCDSIINITLSFFDEATEDYSESICRGDSIDIEGSLFYEGNETGVVILEGQSTNGCDSTLMITIDFLDAPEGNFESAICGGDTLEYGGELFYMGNLTGQVLIPDTMGSLCDSLITVEVSILDTPEGIYENSICGGDTLEYEGAQFYLGNLSGQVVVADPNGTGCDSLITVDISVLDTPEGVFERSICAGDSIEYQGSFYYDGNLTGQVIVPDPTGSVCDSLISVNISITDTPEVMVTLSKCEGDTIYITDINYEITDDNLDGSFQVPSLSGCDTLYTYTTFNTAFNDWLIDTVLCEGQTFTFNNETYDQAVTGEQILLNGNGNGECDTLVDLSLSFESFSANTNSNLIGENTYQLNLNSTEDFESIEWMSSFADLSCTMDCMSTEVTISEDTEILLTAVSSSGCLLTESFLLNYIVPGEITGVYFPNIFTPDGDGLNDTYVILGTDGILIDEFYIYDRWGNLLFTNFEFFVNDPSQFWDGTFNEEEVVNGVYVGMARYKIGEEEFIKVADITVTR